VYYEFVENAKVGAVKIIEGNVQSLNPNDVLEQQIFIYNNIFFSFCVDSPLDFSKLIHYLINIGETINESIPTYSAVNSDFRGIQSLEHLDQD
jgi:protein TIF31